MPALGATTVNLVAVAYALSPGYYAPAISFGLVIR